jgi:uncharacterized protein DUF4276
VIRVHIVVEGSTEESFVNEVLGPALWPQQVYLIPLIIGAPGHKGGNVNYARLKKDILLQLKQDKTAYCSTMLDLYGMGGGFPGTPLPPNLPNLAKVSRIEEAMKADIVGTIPELRPDLRFLPYMQLHEYEGLLFSDPIAFAAGIGHPHLSPQLQQVRDSFATPEDINDDPNTAPSKRVLSAYPAYRKVLDGTLAAQSVGVAKIRQECAHFRSWIERLEALGAT